MFRIARRAPSEKPLLWDGAIGAELIARGLDLAREPPEAWTRSHPDVLGALHASYVAAGADLVQTNTFGGSRPRLERAGLAAELVSLNRAAVAIARRAAAGRPVVASLGPTGIDPFGAGASHAIRAAFEEQIAALVAEGVDALCFETMLHPVEAVAAVEAGRALAARLPVIVSATFALGDRGYQTPLGVPLVEMARAIEGASPDALGVNCSLEARKMVGLVRKLRERTERPIVAQPQGGPVEVECRGPRRPPEPSDFVRGALACLDAGADAIGGCCGAGPEHIGALAQALASPRATVVDEDELAEAAAVVEEVRGRDRAEAWRYVDEELDDD